MKEGFTPSFLDERPPRGAGRDDFYDACACAWSAKRILYGKERVFPCYPLIPPLLFQPPQMYSMQHVVCGAGSSRQSRLRPRSEYFAVAGGGGADADAKQARRILAITMVLDGHSLCWPRRPVPWTGRRYATGCIATRGWLAGSGPAPAWASASSGRPSGASGEWVETALTSDRWRGALALCDLRDRSPPSCSLHERASALLEMFQQHVGRPVHPQRPEAQGLLTSLSWRAPHPAGCGRPSNLVSGWPAWPAGTLTRIWPARHASAYPARPAVHLASCSAPSARHAAPAPPWSCRLSVLTP